MSDEIDPELPEQQNSVNWKNLERKAATAEKERDSARSHIAELRALLVKTTAEAAGFKPNDQGEFVGQAKLLMKEFQASLADDSLPTKEALLALADEYGMTPGAPAPGPSVADELNRLQAPQDQLRAIATVPDPVGDLPQQIADAEAKGDYSTSRLLKNQQAEALMRAG